jgi:hypothetical protein
MYDAGPHAETFLSWSHNTSRCQVGLQHVALQSSALHDDSVSTSNGVRSLARMWLF